jgi:hypothetical protein
MTSRPLRLLAALSAALALAGVAGAATTPKASLVVVKKYGFSILLPPLHTALVGTTTWYPIPRTLAAIKQTIAGYKAAHDTSLASAYGEVDTSQLSKYAFQAFLWPPLESVVPTEVSVQVVSGLHLTAADLTAAGTEYANALSGSGTVVSSPTRLTLAAGAAEFVEANVNNGGGVHTGAALYLFVHGGRLYVVSFEIDATLLAESSYRTVLREIANTFTYKT